MDKIGVITLIYVLVIIIVIILSIYVAREVRAKRCVSTRAARRAPQVTEIKPEHKNEIYILKGKNEK